MSYPMIEIGDLMLKRNGSVDPSKFPDETFELHSIPAFDKGTPDIVKGSEIGSSKQLVQENDVMISKIVPHIRRASVVCPKGDYRQIASGEWIVFRSDKIYPDYLKHVLISDTFNKQFMATVSGVGGSLLRARPAFVAKIKIALPPLAEQRRIASILDQADVLRQKRQQAIEKLDQLLQATFIDMFGDPVSNPKGWDKKLLSDLVTIDAPLVEPMEKEFENLLHYGPDRISKDSGKLLPALTAKEDMLISKKFLCDDRHILYSKIRPYLNKVAMVQEKCLCSADVYPVEPKSQLTKHFLWHILRSKSFLDHAETFSNRANIPKINRNQFLQYECIVPTMEAQQKFENISKDIQRQIDFQNLSLELIEKLFSSLQNQAFNGTL
ncbi:restriction endonuclease subunit S [Acinetobacter sp. YH16057]|uniref:restriction endonuclease subunit S n=1 Tax=Acinetobacter sp. YH16057 TaxID=2601195 RepID=UPI0015D32A52|nr:restriction endonuclease subunit S [Acinetobacter sp. YH16057]